MGFYEVLRKVAESAGVSLSAVGLAMGKTRNYVNNGIVRGSDPSTGNAAAMLAACGWSLLAVPPDAVADAVAAGALAVEPPAADAADADRRALERKRERLRRELEQTERLLG